MAEKNDAIGNHEEMADVLSRICPEECPNDDLRLKASEVAAAHVKANMASYRERANASRWAPDEGLCDTARRSETVRIAAREGRRVRNEWYAANA